MKVFRFVVWVIIVADFISAGLPVCGVDVGEYNKAIEAYRDVLQGNIDYFCTEHYYAYSDDNWFNVIDGYTVTNAEEKICQVEVIDFALIDMDGDSMPEVILKISFPHWDKIVLHYENGIVYGYYFGFRSMDYIKKDRTYGWSGGAGNWGFNNLQFSNGRYEEKILGCIDYPLFIINGEEVSQDLWDSFANEQHQKEEIDWYEFNETNINKYLTTIPVVEAAPKTGDFSVVFAVVGIIVAAVLLAGYRRKNI